MHTRRLGSQGLTVSALGLGCAGMSAEYGVPDDVESTVAIHRAVELGVTLFDTSDAYGTGHNEQLVGTALRAVRQKVLIATKFGNIRGPKGERGMVNGHPDYVPIACEASLLRLGTDVIDVYYQHRVDPNVPIEETVGAMGRLVEQGKVRFLGICEAGPETIARAHSEYPISVVQTEYSLWSRDVEDAVLPQLRRLDIGLVPYSPLGRGFLTGAITSPSQFSPADVRNNHPRFQQDNINRNLHLLETVKDIATAHGCSLGQVALAWVLSQGSDIVPIPGTRHRGYVEQNVAATLVQLRPQDLVELDRAFPKDAAAGLRYPKSSLKRLGL